MTWADQLTLNKFASDNNRRHVLNAEIASIKVRSLRNLFNFNLNDVSDAVV
jgi:hypothetical protein